MLEIDRFFSLRIRREATCDIVALRSAKEEFISLAVS